MIFVWEMNDFYWIYVQIDIKFTNSVLHGEDKSNF